MQFKIPTVLRSQEIIDKSFSRASKIEEPYFPDKVERIKKEVQDRISAIESISCSHLDKLVKRFPSIERMHPFYRSLIDLMFDVDQYKIALSKVDATSANIKRISTEYIRKLRPVKDVGNANQIMRAYYGRFASLIEDLNETLLFLGRCRDYIRKLPEVRTDLKTYIIAGMPNVGKSSLLASLTTAKPKIASYPFTTKNVIIGYNESGSERIQFIDTPGILDRDFSEMNEIEKNAILAIRFIEGKIIFLFDYSTESLYTREQQEHLYEQIKNNINPNIIRVQTKLDISTEKVENIAISVNIESGLEPLRKIIFDGGVIDVRGRN